MAGVVQQIPLGSIPAWLENAQRLLGTVSFEPALKACQIVAVSATTKNFQAGKGPSGEAWAPLKGRSGKPLYDKGLLMASVTAAGAAGNVSQLTDVTLRFGTNLEYAAIHQYGGTITPKAAKALAIPITPEAKRSGGPRRMGDLHLLWAKGKPSGVLQDARGKTQFVLVHSVTIPARPFLGWNNDMAMECGEVIGDFGERQIAKA